MQQILLSREDVAKRWGVTTSTIINYENDGIITRIPDIPTPRYNLAEIQKLEGTELNAFSPLERKKLERENRELKEIINRQNELLRKYSALGVETINFMTNSIA